MTVVISGAGPAGLVAAIRLRLQGASVVLLERAEEPQLFADAGGAYELSSRTLELLDDLGAGADVRRASMRLGTMQLLDWRGRSLQRLALAAGGFEIISITRSALQRVLLERLQALGGRVECGQAVARVEQGGLGVTVTTAAGRAVQGAWLIAADGVHSRVRRTCFSDVPPIDLGYVAIWGRSAAEASSLQLGEARGYLAPGRSVVVAHAGATLLWTALIARVTPGEDVGLAGAFEAFPADVRAMLLHASTARTRIYEHVPLRSFIRERVVLVGDAAHGMSPFLGVGANSAIEDACTLVETGFDAAALARWDHSRVRVTTPMIGQARRLGSMMHAPSRLGHAAFRLMTQAIPSALVVRDLRRRHDASGVREA